ncbi:hypothetical protein HY642_04410 [Candidatus Woesearchaeota archaeon]|nr:hypothetical protein [Candidatus Woesearchaeota archaeon]
MQVLYGGFIQDGYRIRTYIADSQNSRKEFLIKAYRGERKLAQATFPMDCAPSWSTGRQCWNLSKRDDKNLEVLTQRLMGVLRRNS